MLFKARWWVVALCWIFILYGMVLLDPFVAKYFSPIHGVYNRFIITIMGLMILAYVTKNLRRRFRRARLEVKVLNQMSSARGRFGGNGKKDDDGDTKEEKKGFLQSRIQKLRETRDHVSEEKNVKRTESSSATPPESAQDSMEEYLAYVGAYAKDQVAQMTGEKPMANEPRKPWRLGGKSSGTELPGETVAAQLEQTADDIREQARAETKRIRNRYRRKNND